VLSFSLQDEVDRTKSTCFVNVTHTHPPSTMIIKINRIDLWNQVNTSCISPSNRKAE